MFISVFSTHSRTCLGEVPGTTKLFGHLDFRSWASGAGDAKLERTDVRFTRY